MAWVKLDDGFLDNPKVIEAGPLAGWLYLAGLCWAARNLTDGRIPRTVVPQLCRKLGINRAQVQHLLSSGLWRERAEDFVINDYLEYQPSKEKVLARRARWAAAKRDSARDSAPDSAPDSAVETREAPRAPSRPITYLHPPTSSTGAVDNSRWGRIVKALLDSERVQANGGIKNTAAWEHAVRHRLEGEHGARIGQLLERYPDAPDNVIVAAVRGDTHSLRYYEPEPSS